MLEREDGPKAPGKLGDTQPKAGAGWHPLAASREGEPSWLDRFGLSHAYLLEGSREETKLALRKLAREILTESGGADPEAFDRGTCADFLVFSEEKVPIDQVRTMTGEMYRKPLAGLYRVFAIDYADAMRADAQNALLKSLEEPPSYLVWILATVNRNKLLPTIMSRCRIVRARQILEESVARGDQALESQVGASKATSVPATSAQATSAQAPAQQAMGPSTGFSAQEEASILTLVEQAFLGRGYWVATRKDIYQDWMERKQEFLAELTNNLSDMLQYKLLASVPSHPQALRLQQMADAASLGQIERALRQVEGVRALLAVHINFRMALDHLFFHWGQEDPLE